MCIKYNVIPLSNVVSIYPNICPLLLQIRWWDAKIFPGVILLHAWKQKCVRGCIAGRADSSTRGRVEQISGMCGKRR